MSVTGKPMDREPGGEETLDRLVLRVLGGDVETYREIIAACEARVRVVLAAIVPDRERVEDLAQEVFVTAYGKLREYRSGTDFRAWLTAIARNLALNERRRWLRHHRFKETFRAEMETALDPMILEAGGRFGGDVLEALRECLGRLQEPARGVTEEVYLRGSSGVEVAARRNRTPGWVRLILFRARAALATCLQTKGML